MQNTALIFPGQGSQQVGMGKDFAQTYPIAKEIFQQADDLLGVSLSQLMFDGDAETLNQTYNTQAALYVCSAAILQVFRSEYPQITPIAYAGHSLGEFTALYAAGALTFEDGLRLVRERGRLMGLAGEKHPGAMAALLGLATDVVREICQTASEQIGAPVVLANDNCPGQVVISGDTAAIDAALQLAQEHGAKKAIKLAVSVAAHSPLMQPAADDFRSALDATTFTTPHTPIYANATAQPIRDIQAIRAALNHQLTHPVRWTESVQAMLIAGVTQFIEIGSGDVLTGLIKRIDRQAARVAIQSVPALQAFQPNA